MKKIGIILLLCICLCGCKNEKRLVCVLTETSEYSEDETTFDLKYEKDELVYATLTLKRDYQENIDEMNNWLTMESSNITNSSSLGITGGATLQDTVAIATYNYDVKNHPNLKRMVAEDTKYKALKEVLTDEKYVCTEK